MKSSLISLRYLLVSASFMCSSLSYALNSSTLEEQAKAPVIQLYQTLNAKPAMSMVERINWFSAQLKGTPYVLGSLGEGPDAQYDQFPKYRLDAFDCDTYVNTVLSLALADSFDGFQQCMNSNRYKDGTVKYTYRNHFTDLDWNINNQKRGVFKDITQSITDQNKKPVAQYAKALIDKASWYQHHDLSTIRLQTENKSEQIKRLDQLKKEGMALGSTPVEIPYIPLTALFKNNQPDMHLFSQIPQSAIIEIVRPNWDLKDDIGTALNVSHLGFAIWINGQLYFREASSEYNKVVDVPLIEYLQKAIKSPTIKGINLQIIIPNKPLDATCSVA